MRASAQRRPSRPRRLGLRGTSALEFALLAPSVVMVILVCLEAGWQIAVGAALEYGAQRAARLGVVGSVVANGATAPDQARKSAIRALVLTSTGGMLHDSQLADISTQSFAGFSAAGGNGTSSPGAGGDVVRYKLTYVQPFIMGPLAETMTGLKSIEHTSTVVLTNEPFPKAP